VQETDSYAHMAPTLDIYLTMYRNYHKPATLAYTRALLDVLHEKRLPLPLSFEIGNIYDAINIWFVGNTRPGCITITSAQILYGKVSVIAFNYDGNCVAFEAATPRSVSAHELQDIINMLDMQCW